MPVVSKLIDRINFICILMPIYCFTSCGPMMLDREEVIDRYGPEVINYFYETAFHMDSVGGIRDEAIRWKEDVRVSLHGEMLEKDSAYVREALLEINSLELPILVSLVSDPEESNFMIFFGSAETVARNLMVDSARTVGIGILGDNSGAIKSAKIGIPNDIKIYSQTNSVSASLLRKGVILEEMVQALGIVGDSFTYYGSRFFEGGTSTVEGLSDIDRKVVKLLYDSRVFGERIMRKRFEEEYGDLLYDRINPEKLHNLACEYGLDRQDLQNAKEMVFRPETDARFVKFPRTTFLKLSGDSTAGDVEFWNALIARFNAITPWFHLKLEQSNTIWNAHPTLTIHYEAQEKHKGVTSTQVAVVTSEMMFTYNISGDIWMRFHNSGKELVPYNKAISFRHEVLTRALFKALGLSTRAKILMNPTLESLKIDDKYEDYFRFLYDPRFPSNITRTDFEKVIKSIN